MVRLAACCWLRVFWLVFAVGSWMLVADCRSLFFWRCVLDALLLHLVSCVLFGVGRFMVIVCCVLCGVCSWLFALCCELFDYCPLFDVCCLM